MTGPQSNPQQAVNPAPATIDPELQKAAELQERVIKYVQEKWGQTRRCPMCDNVHWLVYHKAFELREFSNGMLDLTGKGSVFPVIPVECKNCKYIVFISAISSGLIPRPPEPKP